jgi:hypothetical protein
MNKKLILISIAVIVLLFLSSFVSVFSVQADASTIKPQKTPGAKATENAIEHETEGKGKGKQKVNYKGTIATVSETSLDLTLEDNSVVTFIINGDTQIKIPSLGKNATIADLVVGIKAQVRAQKDGETFIALSISLIPGKPVKIHRVGIVTDYQPGASITIQDKEGNLFMFLLTEDTKILPEDRTDQLKVGSLVTIICPRDVTGGYLSTPSTPAAAGTATGIVVHPEGSATGAFSSTPEEVEKEPVETDIETPEG